jgi:uncharacterized protein YfdQ (DUF2303 family)|tara:strand:+ start:316 stop:555 length:240 start_codon:yes stop_codon:yes gene_type:complete
MYYLSEIVVNSSQISFLTENKEYKTALNEGSMDIGLNTNAEFTDIVINIRGNSETITVIGDIELVESKINTGTKKLLRD